MNFNRRDRETMAVYLVFLAVIIAAVAFAGRFVFFRPWTTRTHTAAAELDGKIYLFGGRHRTGKPLEDILCADFEANTLKSAGTLPEPLMSVTAASDGTFIYFTGGYNGKTYNRTLYRYDPEKETCTPISELPYSPAYGSLSAGVGSLYLSGGWDGRQVRPEILRIDPRTGDAGTAAMLPAPLQYPGSCFIDDTLYIIGGEDDAKKVRSEVYAFNPEDASITIAGRLTAPLCRSPAAAVGSAAYLAGGWSRGTTDFIQAVIPAGTGIIIKIAGTLPQPEADLAAASYNGRVYIFGGTDPKARRQIRIVGFNPETGETEDLLMRSFAWW